MQKSCQDDWVVEGVSYLSRGVLQGAPQLEEPSLLGAAGLTIGSFFSVKCDKLGPYRKHDTMF